MLIGLRARRPARAPARAPLVRGADRGLPGRRLHHAPTSCPELGGLRARRRARNAAGREQGPPGQAAQGRAPAPADHARDAVQQARQREPPGGRPRRWRSCSRSRPSTPRSVRGGGPSAGWDRPVRRPGQPAEPGRGRVGQVAAPSRLRGQPVAQPAAAVAGGAVQPSAQPAPPPGRAGRSGLDADPRASRRRAPGVERRPTRRSLPS